MPPGPRPSTCQLEMTAVNNDQLNSQLPNTYRCQGNRASDWGRRVPALTRTYRRSRCKSICLGGQLPGLPYSRTLAAHLAAGNKCQLACCDSWTDAYSCGRKDLSFPSIGRLSSRQQEPSHLVRWTSHGVGSSIRPHVRRLQQGSGAKVRQLRHRLLLQSGSPAPALEGAQGVVSLLQNRNEPHRRSSHDRLSRRETRSVVTP